MEKASPLHSLILPGYVTENSLRGFLATRLGAGPTIGNSIAGTPKTVLDKLIADYDYLDGFGYIIVGAGPGNATHEQTLRHMTLFPQEVMPVSKRYSAQKRGRTTAQ